MSLLSGLGICFSNLLCKMRVCYCDWNKKRIERKVKTMKKSVIKPLDILLLILTAGLWIFVIIYKLYVNYQKNTNPPKESNISYEAQDDLIKVKVAGVTFKNGRKSRQTILRQIRFSNPPFDGEVDIELKREEYEGRLAIGVYANNEKIGAIPKELTEKIDEIMDDIMNIDIEVYGGGKLPDGTDKSYGCVILINV